MRCGARRNRSDLAPKASTAKMRHSPECHHDNFGAIRHSVIVVNAAPSALPASIRPQDFSHLGVFELIMLGAFAFALYRGVTLPWLRIVMLFGVLHLSLSQVRHADLLGLLAPIFLARPLAEQFKEIAADQASSGMRRPAWIAAAALVVLTGISGLASIRSVTPADRITPASTIRAIDMVRAGPILNDYDFGGY